MLKAVDVQFSLPHVTKNKNIKNSNKQLTTVSRVPQETVLKEPAYVGERKKICGTDGF